MLSALPINHQPTPITEIDLQLEGIRTVAGSHPVAHVLKEGMSR